MSSATAAQKRMNLSATRPVETSGISSSNTCMRPKRSSRLRSPGLALCCFLTPALNTLLYIVGNWMIFHDTWLNVSVTTYGYTGGGGASLLIFMLGLVAVNGLAEAASSLVLGTAVCKALEKTVHRNEVRSAA